MISFCAPQFVLRFLSPCPSPLMPGLQVCVSTFSLAYPFLMHPDTFVDAGGWAETHVLGFCHYHILFLSWLGEMRTCQLNFSQWFWGQRRLIETEVRMCKVGSLACNAFVSKFLNIVPCITFERLFFILYVCEGIAGRSFRSMPTFTD